MPSSLVYAYRAIFGGLQSVTEDWLLGLSARLAFASVLLFYFINSALTKIGSGFPAMFIPQDNAYSQIVPMVVEKFDYDASKVPMVPYGLIVFAGTYAEFILPVLVVIGLFTRLASLGMIGFIAVMTYVDIFGHQADAKTIGMVFDRIQDSAIADQRILWLFPLIYLVLRGPGWVSIDGLFGRSSDS
jgi:putative oxidoreductase